MYPAESIWIFIALAFVFAIAPFLTERAFVFTLWSQAGEGQKPFWFYPLRALLSYAALGAGCWLLGTQAGNLPYMLAGVLLLGLSLYVPGTVVTPHVPVKHVSTRLLEVLVGYFVVGAIGFAIEANYANPSVKNWEFYAIAACLYVVLAYPGFVWRHLMKHPGRHKTA
ncbi:DUF2818 family protein [Advenella sp. FME57]|uniref:DUF2818 domain-containing protein n=3 Tax=Advenella TaxID=290425 RepID=A0A356LJX8_9BURK|nr:DUF2818 family protein [Advenella sp. FME57]HBP30871.1 DUF2818 domain-containing protein [Advenella kashmirensis]